ncbi:hypothetical protein B0A48_11213 [Cryoendolithus antarcticus]|uniref:G-patch domain-containing protein n=1 Tax=Cryoendolithus antarcticus TaxID=1507870 RepID=A0A1V8SV58_9PEZI|nr:hypothetical protein B0A48_11213 [Cryoendolithus antarcticus]
MASPPAKKPGFSLYGDLLDPSTTPTATITGAPVKYAMKPSSPLDGDAAAAAAAKKKKDASLKFQPVRRAQQPAKAKGKPPGWSSSSSTIATPAKGHQTSSSVISAEEPARAKFEDWVGDEEEEVFFDHRPKAPRGGKKRKGKKGGAGGFEEQEVDWERVYDPARPSHLAAYRGSTEQEAERREWKEWLYLWAEQGRAKRPRTDDGGKKKAQVGFAPPSGLNFAPPSGMSFAPPPIGSDDRTNGERMDVDDDDDEYQPTLDAPAMPAPRSSDFDAATGEDAFARRMRLSGMARPENTPPPPPPPPVAFAQAPPAMAAPAAPAVPKPQPPADVLAKLAAAKAKLEAAKAKHEADRAQAAVTTGPSIPATSTDNADSIPPPPPSPPPEDPTGSSISRAPVLYTSQPPAPPAEAVPRSKAPGQAGFGARMMAKMGWEKGQGLGAKGEGITTALVAQAEKRKKRADASGGGWAQPRNMGKIVGGKRKAVEKLGDDDGAFGAMSYVVKLTGMLEGLDVDWEMSENNLMQEIGEEFGGKYESIERVFIWREAQGGKDEVFVKFTSQLSALRAVNATDGMTFAANAVVARFYDDAKFEAGVYA